METIKDLFLRLYNEVYSSLSLEGKGWSWSFFVHILVFLCLIILPLTALNSVYRSLARQEEEKIIYVDLQNIDISTKTILPEIAANPKVDLTKKEETKKEEKKQKETKEKPLPKIPEDKTKETTKEEIKIDQRSPEVIKTIPQQKGQEPTPVYEQINKDKDLPETDDPNFIKREQLGGDQRNEGKDMSISLKDAIRVKLRQCWNVDPNALGAKDMKITINVEFAIDGSVTKVEIVDKVRFEEDMPFRAVASSARRAVFICSPFDFLPQDLYEKWKTAEFNFYPYQGKVE